MYQYFDFVIASDLPLPELAEANGGKAKYTFTLLPPGELLNRDWLHHWRYTDGNTFLSVAREGNEYILHFPETADFRIFPNTGAISCRPLPGITAVTIRHLLLDQVLPRVVGHHGRIVLHASAVSDAGQAILFMGVPWSGKSTLAVNYAGCDGTMLADDCVLLENERSYVIAMSNYSGSRLWQDSLEALHDVPVTSRIVPHYSLKKRLFYQDDGLTKQRGNLPVKAVFLLGSAERGDKNISISQLSGARVITELLKYTFVLDVKDKENMKNRFHAHGKIALSLPFYRLDYPRDYSILGKVFEAVNEALSGKRVTSCSMK